MVSVDPERDTPEALAKYVTAFDPRFLALRGDLAATKKVAGEFKIYFEKRKSGDSYTVNHSAQSYVIDPQGRLRLLVRHDRIGVRPAARLEGPAGGKALGGHRLLHLLERFDLDLADALGRNLELRGKVVQGERRFSRAASGFR